MRIVVLAVLMFSAGCAGDSEAKSTDKAAAAVMKKLQADADAERARIAAAEKAAADRASKTPATVKVTLTSEPAGARVFRAPDVTTPVGTTPYVFDAKANEDFDVLLKLEGYQAATRTISTGRTGTVSVRLEKATASGSSSSR